MAVSINSGLLQNGFRAPLKGFRVGGPVKWALGFKWDYKGSWLKGY